MLSLGSILRYILVISFLFPHLIIAFNMFSEKKLLFFFVGFYLSRAWNRREKSSLFRWFFLSSRKHRHASLESEASNIDSRLLKTKHFVIADRKNKRSINRVCVFFLSQTFYYFSLSSLHFSSTCTQDWRNNRIHKTFGGLHEKKNTR